METEAGVGHGLLADVLHRYAPFMLDTVVAVLSLLTVFTLGPALFVEHAQRQDWEDQRIPEPWWVRRQWASVGFIQQHGFWFKVAAFIFAGRRLSFRYSGRCKGVRL